MRVADEYVGNAAERRVAARLDGADHDRVVLSDVERRRSRVRTETTDGAPLGIVVGRDLCDGDVVAADDRLVVVELAPVEAVAFDLSGLSLARALSLGHAVGNRHRDLATRDGEGLVRVADTADRTRLTVERLLPPETTTRLVSVPLSTFDGATADHTHERERAPGPGHDHAPPDSSGGSP